MLLSFEMIIVVEHWPYIDAATDDDQFLCVSVCFLFLYKGLKSLSFLLFCSLFALKDSASALK